MLFFLNDLLTKCYKFEYFVSKAQLNYNSK
nr:MAG TPA: hypothetical protein [Caudoviricetes sp.]